MTDNKAVFQRLHGIGKNVATDSLNYVFYKFGTVALNSAPFLGSINPHIGDTLSAELVHADTGFDIECASDLTEPYAMKPEVYSALVELCADICRRNGKKRLVWIPDRDKALTYTVKSDEMLLTVHRWFAKKSCPGNWLFERMGGLAQDVNSQFG